MSVDQLELNPNLESVNHLQLTRIIIIRCVMLECLLYVILILLIHLAYVRGSSVVPVAMDDITRQPTVSDLERCH